MTARFLRGLMLLLVAACVPALQAQSLGDVARQEEARRKGITAPAKVITNDNLRAPAPVTAPVTTATPAPPAGGAPPVTAAPPSASGTQPGAPAGQAAATEAPADEATWRQRVTTARDSLTRSETFQEALQTRINALTADFANRADPAQRAGIATDRQKALAELDRVKQEIQQYQKQITDIQEEARKAGVPAGWVR
jgi:hypothetical protein